MDILKPFALAATLGLPALPAVAQDYLVDLPRFDNTQIFYLDPYRAPQNGSDTSEFVHAMGELDRICRAPINNDISNLCDNLETALWEGYPEGSPIDMRFDARELEYLPLQLEGETASIAAGITGVFLQIFNQQASEYEIPCPEYVEHNGNVNHCFTFGELLLVILKPPA